MWSTVMAGGRWNEHVLISLAMKKKRRGGFILFICSYFIYFLNYFFIIITILPRALYLSFRVVTAQNNYFLLPKFYLDTINDLMNDLRKL